MCLGAVVPTHLGGGPGDASGPSRCLAMVLALAQTYRMALGWQELVLGQEEREALWGPGSRLQQ